MDDSNRRTFRSRVAGTTSAAFETSDSDSDGLSDHLVIAADGPDRTLEYMLVVSEDVERTDDASTAPVADECVSRDGDGTVVEGGIVRGTLAGGGVAFRYSGGIVNFGASVTAETADSIRVFRNGDRLALDRIGSHPAAETPVEFVDGHTAVVSGEWTDARGHVTTMYADGVGTEYESLGAATGAKTTLTRENDAYPFALDSVELYDGRDGTVVHAAENPFAGPWNLEAGIAARHAGDGRRG
ncbi:hypothetical protein [Halorussus amylolyticus]|uniref:hypothetical protein n=1 Tax=Halorussus amylolyticus TaxID=1126242 RepID=UPI00105167E7|nr:hypothetical protein [Halorussus amylolyticus]